MRWAAGQPAADRPAAGIGRGSPAAALGSRCLTSRASAATMRIGVCSQWRAQRQQFRMPVRRRHAGTRVSHGSRCLSVSLGYTDRLRDAMAGGPPPQPAPGPPTAAVAAVGFA